MNRPFFERVARAPSIGEKRLVVTLLIAWLAVGSPTLHAARARPAEVLRYE
jgi:hypothetical protein